MIYLFLFSILAGSPDAAYFRISYADQAACDAARASVIIRHYSGNIETTPSSTLAMCSADANLPSAIAVGTIPMDALTP